MDTFSSSLQGQLLIAQPAASTTFFDQGVVLVCEHDGAGAWGLMLNKPSKSIMVRTVAETVGIDYPYHDHVFIGGPVQPDTIYILHTPDVIEHNTRFVTNSICATSSVHLLSKIAQGIGPQHYKVCMGLSTWQSGQLDGEQSGQHPWTPEHRWLTAPCSNRVLKKDVDNLWKESIAVSIQNKVSEAF